MLVTDCIEMDAIPDVEEGAVRSLAAGVNVVMACHTFDKHIGAINKVYEAVEGGRLDLETLKVDCGDEEQVCWRMEGWMTSKWLTKSGER